MADIIENKKPRSHKKREKRENATAHAARLEAKIKVALEAEAQRHDLVIKNMTRLKALRLERDKNRVSSR